MDVQFQVFGVGYPTLTTVCTVVFGMQMDAQFQVPDPSKEPDTVAVVTRTVRNLFYYT